MTKDLDYRVGDSRELLKTIPDSSIRLAITSPPYNIGKPYGKYKDNIPLNEWEELLNDVSKEVCRVLTPDGSFFLNLGQVPTSKTNEILPLQYIGYQILKDNGLFLRNIITWTFNNMQNCVNRLSGRYENILWFVKDLNNYIFNLNEIRVPYISKNDKRLKDGTGRNPTDVWYFDRVNNMTKQMLKLSHPTVYPLPMIIRIIKMSTHPGDIILDPFAGSGTSLIAAKIMGRRGIGFDLDEKYQKEFKQRLLIEGNISASVFDELLEDSEKKKRIKREYERVISQAILKGVI
jgi:DNA modification methylase